MKNWKLSASMIAAFKACAYRCYMSYVLGVRQIETSDTLRMGTNWHAILEIMGFKPDTVCPVCSNGQKNPDCPICLGTDIVQEDLMQAVVGHLNQAYSGIPVGKDQAAWEAERAVLLYSLAGYNWYHDDDDFEVIGEEVPFDIPLVNPSSGRALPNVRIVGKIDKLIRMYETGQVLVGEHKSTSKPIDPDSTYWNHLNLDTQTTLYPYACRYLQERGDLVDYGIGPDDPLVSGVLYDVWHKPQIKPKKLTQADSKKFVETGEYMGDEFDILTGCSTAVQTVVVNSTLAEYEPGKKEGTFAIRETADMFGARLLKGVTEEPTKYFARKTLARTDADFGRLGYELVDIYHTMKFLDKNKGWWHNERQCEATFKCPYIGYCYNNVDPEETLMDGFRRRKKDGNRI